MKSESTNQAARSIQDEVLGLPVHRDVAFSDHKGIYKKRTENRQTKLLEKVPFLKAFLKENEKISLATTACSPASFLEQFFTGSIFVYLKRSLLVFTDKRIFHIPTKFNYSYRNSIAQILYSDSKSLQLKGRKLIVEYIDGKKETFLYIARKEKKKIKTLLQSVHLGGSPSKSQKRTHLCPRCKNELEEGKYLCQTCNLEFKTKEEARRISIIYPGGGYFYTGHFLLGIEDAIAETILLVYVIVALVDVIRGVNGRVVDLIMFAIFLVIEKIISVYHSNHFVGEFIPTEKEIAPTP